MLDPRLNPDPPIKDSVWIPVNQIAERQNELPQKGSAIQVAECEEFRVAAEALFSVERNPVLFSDFEFGESPMGRLWEPNRLLRFLEKPCRVLDMGCGSGRDAIFLASVGCTVTAIDHLPDAIEMAKKLESRYFDKPQVNWVVGKAAEIELAEYDLICSFRFLDRVALARSLEFLSPGGMFMLEALSRSGREQTGSPRNPDWCTDVDEFQSLFPGFEPLFLEESFNSDGKHFICMVARKM